MAIANGIFYLSAPYPCVELPFIGFDKAFVFLSF